MGKILKLSAAAALLAAFAVPNTNAAFAVDCSLPVEGGCSVTVVDDSAQRIQQALDEAKARAEQAARDQWVAQGSDPCTVFPASTTATCIDSNLAATQKRDAEYKARSKQEILDAEQRAKDALEAQWIADGARPCALPPASTTAECVAENLNREAIRQATYQAQAEQDLYDAWLREEENMKLTYGNAELRPCAIFPASSSSDCVAENKEFAANLAIQIGKSKAKQQLAAEALAQKTAKLVFLKNESRPCSVYPASETDNCKAENLAFQTSKADQIASIEDWKLENPEAKVVSLRDEDGDVLVQAKAPKTVDLLTSKVQLVDMKRKVVDKGVVRYDLDGAPYFVFDNLAKSGKFSLEFVTSKKKKIDGADIKLAAPDLTL